MKTGEIVASFIVRFAVHNKINVHEELSKIEGLELHAFEDGKQIITIIATDEEGLMQQYGQVKRTKAVLSVELVFCGYGENGPGREFVNGEIPEWLNSDIDAGLITYNGRLPKYL